MNINVIRWKLNEVMAAKRIRNKDLAKAIDVTENSIYRLRKADKMPRMNHDTLNSLCVALKCQPADLLVYEPDGGENPRSDRQP